MSRLPAARVLASHFFLWKRLPGQEIGLGGIKCSIFCRVLHQQSSLSLNLTPGASLHHAEYGYSPLMQEKCAKNQRIFRRNVRYGGRRFTPQLSVASARSFNLPSSSTL